MFDANKRGAFPAYRPGPDWLAVGLWLALMVALVGVLVCVLSRWRRGAPALCDFLVGGQMKDG